MNITIKNFNELSNIELYNILKLRSKVFVVEQESIYLDLDDIDFDAIHIFIKDNDNNILAYLRVLDNNDNFKEISLGRIISEVRGLGSFLINNSIEYLINKYSTYKVNIQAQKYAEGFYLKCGFITTSDTFILDGIDHIEMELNIK